MPSPLGRVFGTLNTSIMVSMVARTSGPNPDEDDLLELAMIPMKEDKRDASKTMFDALLRPINSATKKSATARTPSYPNKHVYCPPAAYERCASLGVGDEVFCEYFDRWVDKCGFSERVRIVPLCFDWAHISAHLSRILGPKTVNAVFDYRARDFASIMSWENDFASSHRVPVRMNLVKRNAIYMLDPDIDDPDRETALVLANSQIKIYNKLLTDREQWTQFK